MSLKAFHIFFITVSILFLIGLGLWFLLDTPFLLEALNVFSGLLSFTLAGGLMLYLARFIRKFKNLRYQG